MSTVIKGEYKLTPNAIQWGEAWYRKHYEVRPTGLDDDRFGGYIARKQTHIHKLAMVLAASRSNELIVSEEDLTISAKMITDLEADMPEVFAKIGRTEVSVQMDRFLRHVQKRGSLPYEEAYRFIHAHFPGAKDFEDMVAGCLKSGQIKHEMKLGKIWLTWVDL